ncbi:MAG: glycoside hydrolase 43 family protein [bacterium]
MTTTLHDFNYPWVPDQGNGRFRNPVIHADYSDPDVIRHGRDFWMVASSFTATPGLPILHSYDLVNWTLVNHAIRQVPHESYREVRPGCGVWAPSIRFHNNLFWVVFPMPDEGIYVTTATDPRDEWCEPWLLQAAKGWIDPCPFWDDDGKAYLFHAYANSRSGKKERIHARPMSPDGRTLLGEGQEIIHTPHHAYLEGPKLHKLKDWYYILAPGGGVPQGWQVAFRSRNVFGPYEEKVVLERGSTAINGPHQGALVDSPDGKWWFVHFQDTGPFGRITHLQPVEWHDDWPRMGEDYDGNGVGEPVSEWTKPVLDKSIPVAIPQTSDTFDSERLGLQWQWQANHDGSWYSLAARPGWLRLYAQPSALTDPCRIPHLLMQKFPARRFSVEARIDFQPAGPGELAGIAVIGGGESATLSLDRTIGGYHLSFRINGVEQSKVALPTRVMRLRVDVDENANCSFGWADDNGEFSDCGPVFQAKEGGWMGSKVGLFSQRPINSDLSGYADFDYFQFSKLAENRGGSEWECLEISPKIDRHLT